MRSDPSGGRVDYRLTLVRLNLRNRFGRALVTGDCPVAVSLTTHGERIERVYLAIESIGRGAAAAGGTRVVDLRA